MSAHQTTAPLQSTIGAAPVGSALIIRWVHPSPEGPVSPLDVGRFLLGRGEKCRTRLEAEAVSRYHAEILLDGSGPRIRDLGSKNGVYVNGARVEESRLCEGDVVRLGASVGVVVAREPESTGFGEPFPGLLAGPVFWPVLDAARAVARTDLPVIIEGETGTGKERVARAIHGWTGRHGAFVALNCAALPESLAEAELFGYRKGAFTGADRPSQGHFRAADGGTLLLDEVVDLPLPLQAKVLRAIEAREVVPLGETRPVPVDVRLVAAAQTSLHEAVGQKRFRADLLARLDGATVRLPPLRERIQEVPFLFARLAARHVSRLPVLDPRLIEALCRHDWPYNVRELDLLARRMMALHESAPSLRVEHLPDRLTHSGQSASGRADPPRAAGAGRREGRSTPADDVRDFAALTTALEECGGNVSRAAELVGISRPRAYRLIRAHGELDLEALRSGR
ncbi:MAG: sigma 54-interacting transcriptional regulator [Myxococcales bacterium]|nr:sigma 54-interacting transcriptional regulator [Myxococcales bacterium]